MAGCKTGMRACLSQLSIEEKKNTQTLLCFCTRLTMERFGILFVILSDRFASCERQSSWRTVVFVREMCCVMSVVCSLFSFTTFPLPSLYTLYLRFLLPSLSHTHSICSESFWVSTFASLTCHLGASAISYESQFATVPSLTTLRASKISKVVLVASAMGLCIVGTVTCSLPYRTSPVQLCIYYRSCSVLQHWLLYNRICYSNHLLRDECFML